jgi:hypothetical protein
MIQLAFLKTLFFKSISYFSLKKNHITIYFLKQKGGVQISYVAKERKANGQRQ